MKILLVRHGLSQANNRENIGTPAFGSPDAELMEMGVKQARQIPQELLAGFAIQSDSNYPVATSNLYRTKQTAQEAGFINQQHYWQLDELEANKLGLERSELRSLMDRGVLPKTALDEAAETLASPPVEDIWFSHGLRIASICALLGEHQNRRLIPKFCEIRRIDL